MAVVFALGSNGSGQLGIGHCEDVSIPRIVVWEGDDEPPPASVVKVAAGGNHSLLLSGEGALYWSGDPAMGACGPVSGQQPQQPRPRFSKMKIDPEPVAVVGAAGDCGPVRMVAATWEASVFTRLDSQGRNAAIFSCGLGQKGELGQGPLVVRDPRASRLPDFPPAGTEVVDLAAGMSHVVAVLDSGDAYGWGNGRKGQLGELDGLGGLGGPETTAAVFAPRKIAGVGFAVKRAVCGKDFTALFGAPESGELAVLGPDKWGIKSSAPPDARGWVDVGAGWGHVCVLHCDGSIRAWGRNDYMQSEPLPAGQKASQMAVGSEHVVALLQSGDVLAWGWGEHGNCGPLAKQGGGGGGGGGDDDGTKGQRRVIASSRFLPKGTRIAGVGAGCATSWVILEAEDGPGLSEDGPGQT